VGASPFSPNKVNKYLKVGDVQRGTELAKQRGVERSYWIEAKKERAYPAAAPALEGNPVPEFISTYP